MKEKDFQQLATLASRAPSGHNTQPWLFDQEGGHVHHPSRFQQGIARRRPRPPGTLYQFGMRSGKHACLPEASN